jgi:phage-related tail fiber protein
MAFLPETSSFDAGVYQIETTDPVIGGASGVTNAPLKNLTNRTKYLKDQVDAHTTALSAKAPLASPDFTGTPTAPTPATGTNNTQLATTAFVKNEADLRAPAGTVLYVARTTAPSGYLKANGAAVSRATYAALFASIGTAFGIGDGSSTFNLPDLRGEFLRGWDDSRGTDAGRGFGTSQNHAIGVTALANNGQIPQGFLVVTARTPASPITDASDGVAGGSAFADGGQSSISRTSLSTASETRPRNVSLLAVIKY